jgi:hypothetical protein
MDSFSHNINKVKMLPKQPLYTVQVCKNRLLRFKDIRQSIASGYVKATEILVEAQAQKYQGTPTYILIEQCFSNLVLYKSKWNF